MPANTTITIRKGSSSQWSSTNPVLASGEPGYDTTNNILKIGDGVSNWNSLSNHKHSSADISNFNSSVSGLLPNISGSGNVNTSFVNNTYTISVSGLQSAGNYALIQAGDPEDLYAANSYVDRSIALWDTASDAIGLRIADNGIYLGSYYAAANDGDARQSFRDVLQLGSASLANSGDFATSGHSHGNINSSGQIGSVAGRVITTSDDGLLVANNDVQFECSSIFIGVSGDYINNGGIILAPGAIVFSDNTTQETAYTGKIGSIANLPLITTSSGIISTGSFGTSANTFCEGNDSRLSDSRNPLSHDHTALDITDFNSSVSGLFPANLATGIGVSGYVTRWSGTNGLTSGVIFDNATNVGISNINPTFKLDVSGVVRSSSYITSDTEFRLNNQAFSRVASVDSNGGFAGGYNIYLSGLTPKHNSVGAIAGTHYYSDGSIRFFTNSSQAATTNATERLRITAAGDVGIGVTNPSSRLVVDGDVNVGSGNNVNRSLTIWGNNVSSKRTVLKNVNGDSVLSYIVGNQSLNLGETAARFYNINYYAGAAAGGNHNFYVSGTATPEVMIGSGVVGIGTTSPSGRLHVVGTGLFSSTAGLSANALLDVYSTTSGEMVFNVEGTNGSLFSVVDSLSGSLMSVNNNAGLPIFEVFSDDSIIGGRFNQNDFVISSGGNIGIGTGVPSTKLHVVGNSTFGGDISSTGSIIAGSGTAALPSFEFISDADTGLFSPAANTFAISTSGTERLRIDNVGNIGIGKNNPTVRLDVAGNVAVSGSFTATTKSFKINHPSKPGYFLEYGSLESPYHGVRLTGKDTVVNGICIVNLPDYIKDLVLDDDSINIQITNYKHTKILYVQDIKVQYNTFQIGCDTNGLYDFFWTFTGLRKDIPQIITEYPL